MKILQVIDFSGWAIGDLARKIEKHNSHHKMRILEIHPKELRRNPEIWRGVFENEVKMFNPDIIHFHYWDIANTLTQNTNICEDRKVILTHHNQKNLLTHSWEKIDTLVVHTKKAKEILEKAGYWNVEIIQHGIDIKHFNYNDAYDNKNNTIGYVGRVVRWKGLKEVLKVAKELGLKVVAMGRIDDPEYWKECEPYADVLKAHWDTPDEKQVEIFHKMGIYVGNSRDDIEEGTLGFLEAMACGIPVVTTKAGEANDIIKDEENGILVDFENEKSLKEGIQKMMKLDRNKMRQAAWETVKYLNEEIMAYNYEKLYYRALNGNTDLVSVIIPTFERSDTIGRVIEGYLNQDYTPLEIIVIDDNSQDEGQTRKVIAELAKRNLISVRYLNTNYNGYGLAMARNMGIFEARGHYLLFSDDRFLPQEDTVSKFIEHLKGMKDLSAVFGNKGANKKTFIENFFMIRKQHIVQAGMFNERINLYGGQSQEVRKRLKDQGFVVKYASNAIAEQVRKSGAKYKKRYEILKSKTALWKLDH